MGERAFEDCTSLLNIASGIKKVERFAFKNTAWERARAAGAVVYDKVVVGFNGEYPTDGVLVIEEGVEEICSSMFSNNEIVKEVKFPSTLKIISDFAFNGTQLESLTLPNSVEKIGEDVFSNCSKLKSLKLPKNLIMMKNQSKSSIETLYVPKEVRVLLPVFYAYRYVDTTLRTVYFEVADKTQLSAQQKLNVDTFREKGIRVHFGAAMPQA